jgi:hypothetical protein
VFVDPDPTTFTQVYYCPQVANSATLSNNLMTQINLGGSLFGGIIKYTDYPNFISCNSMSAQYIQIEL